MMSKRKYATTKVAASALGISEDEVLKRAEKEGWIARQDFDRWVEILREANEYHEQGVPHFIIWLYLIQVIEQRVLNKETQIELIKEAGLCIIKDE